MDTIYVSSTVDNPDFFVILLPVIVGSILGAGLTIAVQSFLKYGSFKKEKKERIMFMNITKNKLVKHIDFIKRQLDIEKIQLLQREKNFTTQKLMVDIAFEERKNLDLSDLYSNPNEFDFKLLGSFNYEILNRLKIAFNSIKTAYYYQSLENKIMKLLDKQIFEGLEMNDNEKQILNEAINEYCDFLTIDESSIQSLR